MNLPLAQSLAESYLSSFGLTSKGWEVKFTSSKRRFGSCNYTYKRIAISKYLTLVNTVEEVTDTILHEIAHALTPFSGHGKAWKEACIKIGAKPERCYSREVTRVFRLIGTCPGCKKEFRYNRMPRKGKFKYCMACGPVKGKLVMTVNPEFENIFKLGIDNKEENEVQLPVEDEIVNHPQENLEELENLKKETQGQQVTIGSSDVDNIKFTEDKGEQQKMSLMLIKKSALPANPRGRGAGGVSVRVQENGQMGFSTQAAELFNGFTHALIEWDADSREMTITPMSEKKLPKGVTADALFTVGQSSQDSKTKSRWISASGLFKVDAVAYDYKASGTHSYEGTIDGNKLKFTLPTENTPKPKVERKSRKAKGAVAGANGASASNEPALQEA